MRPWYDKAWGHLALLGAGAVLLALAFPTVGAWPLAYVALVPWGWVALRGTCTKRLIWTSVVVGTAWWLWMVRWLIPVTGGGWAALSVFLALYGAGALVTMRWLQRGLLSRGRRLPAVVVLPLAWVSWELLRSYWPAGGFAWFMLGHSQASWRVSGGGAPWIVQAADWLGELTVSLLVAAVNGWLVDVARWMEQKRSDHGIARSHGATKPTLPQASAGGSEGGDDKHVGRQVLIGGAALVVIWSAVGWHAHLREQEWNAGARSWPTLRVAVVQTDVPQSNKQYPSAESETRDWERLLALSRDVAAPVKPAVQPPVMPPVQPPVDLVIWPETVVPAPLDSDSQRYYQPTDTGRLDSLHCQQTITQLARELNTNLMVGTPWLAWERYLGDDGSPYMRYVGNANVAVLYRPDGTMADTPYRKIHRVPFGEYIPWVDAWPWLKRQFIHYLTPYDFDYSVQPGTAVVRFAIGSATPGTTGGAGAGERAAGTRQANVVTPICFEDAVPRLLRRMVYDDRGGKRADVIANLTNDGWFAGSAEPWQHLQIAVLRSVELRVPTARAVNRGVSGFIDTTGRITAVVERAGRATQVDGAAVQELQLDPRPTLYGWWGDTPMIVLALGTGVLTLAAGYRLRRSRRTPGPPPT